MSMNFSKLNDGSPPETWVTTCPEWLFIPMIVIVVVTFAILMACYFVGKTP
jgi:hypothetical protein